MIFVDTNYFLRFLLDDNHDQHDEAVNLFTLASVGKKELVTSLIVVFEIYWVLSSFYGKNRQDIVEVLNKLLNLNFISLPERTILLRSLIVFSNTNLDLEDCYNLCYAKSLKIAVNDFKTFDKKLMREYSK
jgi:predicted nucleic-acid-binding protein